MQAAELLFAWLCEAFIEIFLVCAITQLQRDGAARLSHRVVMHFVTTLRPINWLARYRDGLALCQVWRF